MCSPEPSKSFCSTEKVEVAEFSSEKLLELGKFGFWIHKTLVTAEWKAVSSAPGTNRLLLHFHSTECITQLILL